MGLSSFEGALIGSMIGSSSGNSQEAAESSQIVKTDLIGRKVTIQAVDSGYEEIPNPEFNMDWPWYKKLQYVVKTGNTSTLTVPRKAEPSTATIRSVRVHNWRTMLLFEMEDGSMDEWFADSDKVKIRLVK